VSAAPPIYEYTWNHTTLHALRVDPSITYLQSLFPPDDALGLVEHMYDHFGDEVPLHLECTRVDGRTTFAALQLVRYTTAARLDEIIAYHEGRGVAIFNPHTYILEDGGMKTIDENQLAFKRIVDPHGLMNPGKMRGWWERPA
jgi:FAD/FMN-containing dehydrogenase